MHLRKIDPQIRGSRKWIQEGHLRFEKCELDLAKEAFEIALIVSQEEVSKGEGHPRQHAEALVGLLRHAGETMNVEAVAARKGELLALMEQHPGALLPNAWYGLGAVAQQFEDWPQAQRCFHRYIRDLRRLRDQWNPEKPWDLLEEPDVLEARGLAMMANASFHRGHTRRAKFLAEIILGHDEFRGVRGVIHLLMGTISEREGDLEVALEHYKKAHAAFLEEHNWYHHLYVLYGYARIARLQKNYSQSYWYLDLIDKACASEDFGVLRRELEREKERLKKDAVDLLIDGQKATIQTRDGDRVNLRKQYVLLDILTALAEAHGGEDRKLGKGLSKSDIIETVWQERYRPEAHDNKLYYNINRLRKLIEPDVREPRYLLNWKEGYRLAPGLRVHLVRALNRQKRGGQRI